jgi:two-component system phosphate regulon sensor histidine kinase PhoR
MGLTILGITGFLIYWLRENYAREKNTLAIKTDVIFHETVQGLQVIKLKLDKFPGDSLKKRIFINEAGTGSVHVQMLPRKEIGATIDIVKTRLRDSLKKNPEINNAMIISMNKSSMIAKGDSLPGDLSRPGSDHFFQLLYGIDSLQDSLSVREIDSAYRIALKSEKLNIPFTIKREISGGVAMGSDNKITVGFVNPISYELKLGNTFPYLIKKISLPILFSILLLGITLLSFILLYRNLEKQKKLTELKNEFISNITHELKTPIATVGVAIEALKSFNAIEDARKTKEYLDISSDELQRLSLLVDKVLKLSLFEKKEIVLETETVDMGQLVKEVVSSLRLQSEKCKAFIRLHTEGDLMIAADKLHLQSVVFNLLDNSLKYNKGNPDIGIDLVGKENEITMTVRDNGIGISPEYKERIFEKFFRVPHGNTHNAKGYGLGLSYAAHVIQKHKGKIEVQSEEGKGSRFIITLPRS